MNFIRSIRHYNAGLLILDCLVVAMTFLSGFWIRHFNLFPFVSDQYARAIPYIILIWIFSYRHFGLYKQRVGKGVEFVRLFKANSCALVIMLTISFFYRDFSYSRVTTLIFVILCLCVGFIARRTYHAFFLNVFKNIKWKHRVLIIGCGEISNSLIFHFCSHASEYQIVGFLDDREDVKCIANPKVPRLGKISDLEAVIDNMGIEKVIIAFPSAPRELHRYVINICDNKEVQYRFVPKMFKLMLQEMSVEIVGDVPLVGLKGNNITGYNYIIKRLFDVVLSLTLLIILSPLMLLVAALIKIISPGPVLFVQDRKGYQKESFNFYKFRSMRVNNDVNIHKAYVEQWINNSDKSEINDGNCTVHKLTDDPRIIPVIGKIIRKLSIDELPQLFNVIKGDMSLVGPRPCLEYEMVQYKKWHNFRFDALPGITGLWQVSGRNRLTFDEMVRLDIQYLQNWSMGKDLFIMLKTPYVIFFDKAY